MTVSIKHIRSEMGTQRAETSMRRGLWVFAYLLLSGISGLIELGVLMMAARRASLLAIPVFAMAYQMGAIASHPVRLPRFACTLAGALACACAAIGADSLVLQAAAILGMSILLQHARDAVANKCRVSTFWKRVARVLGFVVAPWLEFWGIVALTPGLIVGMVALGPAAKVQQRFVPTVDLLGVTMAVHQTHYFVYASFLPFVFLRVEAISTGLSGLAFALGWTSYCWAPRLFREWCPERTFILGHLVVVGALVVMACWLQSPSVVLLTWFVSGFGGGTVFCLREIERRQGLVCEGHMDAWENIGHVMGTCVGLLVVATLGQVAAAFWTAGGVALCTAVFGLAIAVRWPAAGQSPTQPCRTPANDPHTGVPKAAKDTVVWATPAEPKSDHA